MARMHKTVEIGEGKSVTVHELTVQQIIDILNDDALSEKGGNTASSLQKFFKQHIAKATDLKLTEATKYAPSELKIVYDAFAEVNATFFDTARAVGAETLLLELKKAMVEDFSKLLAGSLNADT